MNTYICESKIEEEDEEDELIDSSLECEKNVKTEMVESEVS